MAPGLNIVAQWERLIVLRFGKYVGIRGPGMRWLWPIINGGTRRVDLRERVLDVPSQTVITRDNAPIDIDFLIYYQIMEE
ncbi:MAG: SPFH domain-containing protein, partial [Chloroflexi bacterium]|nr:SPFH domain-containing protein [Chloroflexota bacterium]